MAEIPQGNERSGHHHEMRDVQLKPILMFGIGLIVITLGVLVLMVWTFDAFSAHRAQQEVPPSPLAETPQSLPEPHLQITPAQDLRQLRAQEDAVLSSYDWVDRTHGIVRVPIDRAIDLLIERGLPAHDTKPGGP